MSKPSKQTIAVAGAAVTAAWRKLDWRNGADFGWSVAKTGSGTLDYIIEATLSNPSDTTDTPVTGDVFTLVATSTGPAHGHEIRPLVAVRLVVTSADGDSTLVFRTMHGD